MGLLEGCWRWGCTSEEVICLALHGADAALLWVGVLAAVLCICMQKPYTVDLGGVGLGCLYDSTSTLSRWTSNLPSRRATRQSPSTRHCRKGMRSCGPCHTSRKGTVACWHLRRHASACRMSCRRLLGYVRSLSTKHR